MDTKKMSEAELRAELEKQMAENAKLKASKVRALSCKVSQKGAVSVYGLGRFPVTLYRGQWERLIEHVPSIQAFIADNAGSLTTKD
jgi:hypothetical protein